VTAAPRPSIGERLYGCLLRLYPREFHEEYGAEMARLYRDRSRDEGIVSLWMALLSDFLLTAPREQAAMLRQDVRHAVRLWARTPMLAATAILTVALGVGSTAAVFSVVHAVMLRPLPYPAPDRLIELFEDDPSPGTFHRVSSLNYVSWAERIRSLEALAAFGGAGFTLTDAGDPERLPGSLITASMFRVLGLPPLAGRPLTEDDQRPGARRVALLGEPLWRRRFGADPAIVGRSITLNAERYEVVGVVPRAFREVGRAQISAAGDPQVFVPLTIDPARDNRGNHVLRVVGRLRPGVPLDRARDEMRAVGAALGQEFPATNKGWSIHAERLDDSMFEPGVRTSLLVLFAAVVVVLLIACANVANLLLARGISRARELALRAALGAGRTRLVRQLLTENVCLAAVSGCCGLLMSILGVHALRALLPPTLPRVDEIQVDATVVLFGLCVSLASGLFFGMVPAARAGRVDLLPALTQSGKGLAGSPRNGLRQGLVVVQMGLATMLLVGAALLMQSFLRLQHVTLGFEPEGTLTARISVPRTKYADASTFYRRLLESLEAMPEVTAAGVGTSAPFAPGVRRGTEVRDRVSPAGGPTIPAVEHIVSPGYFRAAGIPLLAGRSFGAQDGPESPRVAIVSRAVVQQMWPGLNPIGRSLEQDGGPVQVIGVAGDIRGANARGARGGGLDHDPEPALYLASTQSPQHTMTLLVRVAGEPSAIVPFIRNAVRAIDPAQPVYQVRSLHEWLAESTARPRITTALIGTFAILALLLASVGVYGVLSYSVGQRTQEIGVRMALGATRGDVMRLALQGGMTWAGAGITLGLIGALSLSRVLATLLFAVPARDPITFGAVGAALAIVALTACYLPARRAARIDPMVAVRSD